MTAAQEAHAKLRATAAQEAETERARERVAAAGFESILDAKICGAEVPAT